MEELRSRHRWPDGLAALPIVLPNRKYPVGTVPRDAAGQGRERMERVSDLTAALRENLRRRKAQARGRERPEVGESDESSPDPERSNGFKHC